ncbi:40S ribosomal protein S29-like [Apodemus sylvaticus]|uniref:40S ribosomal protein S29-like n=1 Tax=Apodemus sylvaticus TaxID=10129 RepID=UPI002243D157|nr:40S ribosomal protein S29-like [Apodemus sylvaticus]XP_052027605.1 40S ribosomal protein S29-like [Apodemus sylvaticus]
MDDGHHQLSWSHLQKFGQGSCSCHICSNHLGLIGKCMRKMSHQGFCQYSKDIGFIKLD